MGRFYFKTNHRYSPADKLSLPGGEVILAANYKGESLPDGWIYSEQPPTKSDLENLINRMDLLKSLLIAAVESRLEIFDDINTYFVKHAPSVGTYIQNGDPTIITITSTAKDQFLSIDLETGIDIRQMIIGTLSQGAITK